ncbi:MAG: hypothetical protein HY540_02680, partial [Deltaproteobacteria bacterium]|nr:hypothetical protein [Deltaproteobacteria bacterium]
EVREFLLRGVVQKGAKGIVISDMLLANGRVEKFIRFSVMATVLEKLKMLLPGEAFTRSEIAALSQEELNYLALAVARSADAVAEEAERGKFFDAQAEARAAQELGLPMSQHLSAKSRLLRKQRKLGLGGLLGSSEGEIFEDPAPTQFIPWWHWENLKKPSPARSVTAVFYTALGIVALIGIGVLTMRLL